MNPGVWEWHDEPWVWEWHEEPWVCGVGVVQCSKQSNARVERTFTHIVLLFIPTYQMEDIKGVNSCLLQ